MYDCLVNVYKAEFGEVAKFPKSLFYAGVSKAARACKKEEIKNCASLLNSTLKPLEKSNHNASLERISTHCVQKRCQQLSFRTLLLANEVKYKKIPFY